MPPQRASQLVWLGDLGDGKSKSSSDFHKYVTPNKEAAAHPTVQSCLRQLETREGLSEGAYSGEERLLGQGNRIRALALIEPIARHTCLLPMTEEETAQYQVWRVLGRQELEGKIYWFHVRKVESLLHDVDVQDVATLYRGRAFSLMSEDWAHALFTAEQLGITVEDFTCWQSYSGNTIPRVILRVPKAFAHLVLSKTWSRLAVPDLRSEGFSFLAGWPGLRDLEYRQKVESGLVDLQLAFMITSFSDMCSEPPPLVGVPCLSSSAGRSQLLETLQEVAAALSGSERHTQVLANVYRSARAVQALSDDHLICYEDKREGTKLKFSLMDMLNCFRVAGLLHADEDLREVLELSVQVCLPSSVAREAVAFIRGNDAGRMKVPSKATLSRCRGRVDVAWMLFVRKRIANMIHQQGLKVFIQTDATWQAGLEYQCTLANFVACTDLFDLFKDRSQVSCAVSSCKLMLSIMVRVLIS